jgi:arylsulfatase
LSNARYLNELNGHEIQPLQGESLLGLLQGDEWQREQPIFWEHEVNSAIRLGQFKLVREHGKPWELYDMEVDRTELNNLAGKKKPLETNLQKQYQAWAAQSGVRDWDLLLPRLLQAWNLESVDG